MHGLILMLTNCLEGLVGLRVLRASAFDLRVLEHHVQVWAGRLPNMHRLLTRTCGLGLLDPRS